MGYKLIQPSSEIEQDLLRNMSEDYQSVLDSLEMISQIRIQEGQVINRPFFDLGSLGFRHLGLTLGKKGKQVPFIVNTLGGAPIEGYAKRESHSVKIHTEGGRVIVPENPYSLVRTLALGFDVLSKLSVDERVSEILSSSNEGNLERIVESQGIPTRERQSIEDRERFYREALPQLITNSERVIVDPEILGRSSKAGYVILKMSLSETGDEVYWVAYSPQIGEGVYIVKGEEGLDLLHSPKGTLRKTEGVTRLNKGPKIHERILETVRGE